MIQFEHEWLNGTVSLGAVAGWTADEIRLVSELGYALAKQGLNREAIVIFEGLMVLAPATTYFEAALGALWLREDDPARALPYLSNAVAADSKDFASRINRGEVYLKLEDFEAARTDLKFVLRQKKSAEPNVLNQQAFVRARALLLAVERFSQS